jgi:hypothetical protein
MHLQRNTSIFSSRGYRSMKRLGTWPIEVVSNLTGFQVLVFSIPPAALEISNGITKELFLTLLISPPLALLAARAVSEAWRSNHAPAVLVLLSGICQGIVLGLGLDILLTTYYWYRNPSSPHWEPLVLLLTAVAGVAQTCVFQMQRSGVLANKQRPNASMSHPENYDH